MYAAGGGGVRVFESLVYVLVALTPLIQSSLFIFVLCRRNANLIMNEIRNETNAFSIKRAK